MSSLKSAFDRARVVHYGLTPLAIMFWAVAIDEDRQQRRRENKRRKRKARQTCPPRKPSPPAGPRPF